MMLTALNEKDGRLLDVTALAAEEVDRIHGKRVARRHGYEPVCKGCGRPAHLHLNHHGNLYFQHDPGRGDCIFQEITRRNGGMSPEHLSGQMRIIQGIRSLRGWTAEPEVVVADGAHRLDVLAEYGNEPKHSEHGRFAFEVQLSHQTRGEFRYRTDEIQRLTGCRVRWLTPFADAVGDVQAMICDPDAEMIVDRLYITYEPEVMAPPTAVSRIVSSVHRRHQKHLWHQRGDGYGGRIWVVTSIEAWDRGPVPDPPSAPSTKLSDPTAIDEPCIREPKPGWNAPKTHYPYLDSGEHICAVGGEFVHEPWGFSFDPPLCKKHFQERQDQLLRPR